MRKSKKSLAEISESYVGELAIMFPGIEYEVSFEAPGGHDVWVRIQVPAHMDDLVMQIIDATVELAERYWEKTGVNIVATVVEKEALTHG